MALDGKPSIGDPRDGDWRSAQLAVRNIRERLRLLDAAANVLEQRIGALPTSSGTGGASDLAYQAQSDRGVVTNSNGSGFTVPLFTRLIAGLVPPPGGSDATRFLREDGEWIASAAQSKYTIGRELPAVDIRPRQQDASADPYDPTTFFGTGSGTLRAFAFNQASFATSIQRAERFTTTGGQSPGWGKASGVSASTQMPRVSSEASSDGWAMYFLFGAGSSAVAAQGFFCGVSSLNTTSFSAPSRFTESATAYLGAGRESADTNWFLLYKPTGTTSPTKVNLGFAFSANDVLAMFLVNEPGSLSIRALVCQVTGRGTIGAITDVTASPFANLQPLGVHVQSGNSGTTERSVMLARYMLWRLDAGSGLVF